MSEGKSAYEVPHEKITCATINTLVYIIEAWLAQKRPRGSRRDRTMAIRHTSSGDSSSALPHPIARESRLLHHPTTASTITRPRHGTGTMIFDSVKGSWLSPERLHSLLLHARTCTPRMSNILCRRRSQELTPTNPSISPLK
jgi:hypothetical protein